MPYEFKKIYVDLVTDDGAVLITYLSAVTLWGRTRCFGTVEIYHPDGRREVLQGRGVRFPAQQPRGRLDIALQLDCGDYELHLEPVHGSFCPSSAADRRLCWNVCCVQGLARAELRGPTGRRAYRGTGYADWTRITDHTRRLRLAGVSWGRIHAGSVSIVSTRITSRSGATWQQAVVCDGDRPPRALAVRQCKVAGNRLHLAPEDVPPVTLVPVRALHHGSAFDRERIPRASHRLLCRLVGGPTQESRWLMRVEEGGGWAIHEEVAFRASPLPPRFAPHHAERSLLQLVARSLGCDPGLVRPSSHMVYQLGADSLQLVQIAAAFEQRFGRTLTEQQLDALARPEDLLALIREPARA